MKVDVKKLDATRRELKFEIPKERVSQALDDVYRNIQKESKIKGFRPGKAPRHVLESHYGKLAQDEMIKKIIPEAYQEGIRQHELAPIDMPQIDQVDYKGETLKFTAQLDIKPEVKIKNYKGIKVQRKDSQVSERDVDKVLEMFQKGRGDNQEVKVDDELAKGMGYPDLEAFRQALKRQIEIDKDRQNRLDVENQIADTLIKNAKLVVPPSMIEKQIHYRIEESKKRMSQQGISAEEISKKEKKLQKDLRPVAERDIKLFFILDQIASLENITIQKGENLVNKVMEFLLKEAQWEGGDVK